MTPVVGPVAEVPVVLQARDLQQYVDNTANLSYKFTYLTVVQQDKISFDAAGTATIPVKGLPAGQSGTVVLENIQNHLDAGKDRFEAAVTGTSEVAAAVFASVLTGMAVFFPIVFVEGIAGQIFGDLALTVEEREKLSPFGIC